MVCAPMMASCSRIKHSQVARRGRYLVMLYAIAAILLILWLVGWLVIEVVGAAIHVLIVIAVVVFAIRFFRKRG